MKTNMLKNDHGHYMNHAELFPLLGLRPNGHLPKQGFTTTVQGVTFKCDPAPEPQLVRKWYNGQLSPKKFSKHRVRYLCNCGAWIPYGRAGQHDQAKAHQG
jgi:hypothetical protein